MLDRSTKYLAFCFTLIVLVGLPTNLWAQAADPEIKTWIDESGKYNIKAKFIKLDGDTLQLQAADGKQLNVPFSKLNFASQLQARKAADPKAFEPPVLPSSLAAPPLRANPFPEDPTIEQFLDTLKKELSEDRVEVIWYALTPDIQRETEGIVIKAAEVAGPKFFKQLQAVLPNALKIVRDKRSMILANPNVVRNPELLKNLTQILPATEPMLEVLTKPETWSSENFKEGKVGAWLMSFVGDLTKAQKSLESVLKKLPATQALANNDIKSMTFKVIEKTTDTAKVEIENKGAPKQTQTFKKVGRTWLPDQIADNWQSGFATARAQLDSMDKAAIDQMRTGMSTGLTIANGILGSLANANSQAEFNQLIDPYIAQMGGAFQAMAGQPGMGLPGAGTPGGLPNGGSLNTP